MSGDVGYGGLTTKEMLKVLKERDATIAKMKAAGAGLPPTRLEAEAAFLNSKPEKQLVMTPLEVDVETLEKAFSKKDNAGDKKVTEEEALKVLEAAGYSLQGRTDIVSGYFRVGELDSSKKASYTDLLKEIVRMQTYKVLKTVQYHLWQLEKKKDEYEKMPRMEVVAIEKLFKESGIGSKATKEQMASMLKSQVGSNHKSLLLKMIVRWYFWTYMPDPPKEEVEEKVGGGVLHVDKAKTFVASLVKSLKKATDKPEATKTGTPEQLEVHFLAGKLLGVMELAAAGAFPVESDVAKIFGDDEAAEKLMEKCMACGVKIG